MRLPLSEEPPFPNTMPRPNDGECATKKSSTRGNLWKENAFSATTPKPDATNATSMWGSRKFSYPRPPSIGGKKNKA